MSAHTIVRPWTAALVAAGVAAGIAVTGCSSSAAPGHSTHPPTVAAPLLSATSSPPTATSSPSATSTPPAASSSLASRSAASATGTWTGSYTSTRYTGTAAGKFRVTFTQSGARLSGSITLSATCVPAATISGTIEGGQITFGSLQGSSATVAFTGTMNGDSMHGTYRSGASCGDDRGSWQATR